MLDTDTKRRIDTARDILVGKVPDPKSQVEQITIALIYKFMDDMDSQSEELGGKRKFFTGDFAKYGWAKLMAPSVSGEERIALYGEGMVKMTQNPNIPRLFRDIFKNAYLPYRDPETLKAFLKTINGFEYDHSERLGDAFEYLLSVLGSQGDAGQFRTPRHIIDFIVAVLDPKKTDTVLDPACGTAGFLISAHKHILAASQSPNPALAFPATRNPQPAFHSPLSTLNSPLSTHPSPITRPSSLTPDDRDRLARNFRGYDISPDMVRLSLMNMYLHGFSDPHIFEYDTLTSQDRWNEMADVILANPPFMSPKGGGAIQPHNRFSVQSKRSEVLFVDYIAEHLTPAGRAGIIVPEGVIFQSQTAYKALRKLLVDNYLVAVVSLPAGCFNPYSGVKTSILILDKSLAKTANTIAFFKVENDGFGLGAQRRAIDKNDLPQVQADLAAYLDTLRSSLGPPPLPSVAFAFPVTRQPSPVAAPAVTRNPSPVTSLIVSKEKIAANGDYNLSGERYREGAVTNHSFPILPLSEIADIQLGKMLDKEKHQSGKLMPYLRNVNVQWDRIDTDDLSEMYFEDDELDRFGLQKGDVLVCEGGEPGRAAVWDGHKRDLKFQKALHRVRFKVPFEPQLFVYILQNLASNGVIESRSSGTSIKHLTREVFRTLPIPLPPLDMQQQIVAEIEGYQKVINGARAVLDNYRPHVPISPEWPISQLESIVQFQEGPGILAKDFREDGVPLVRLAGLGGPTATLDGCNYLDPEMVARKWNHFRLRAGDILVSTSASFGRPAIVTSAAEGAIFYTGLIRFQPFDDSLDAKYLETFLGSLSFLRQAEAFATGSSIRHFGPTHLKQMTIPLPPLATQKAIVAEIEAEQALVAANWELIERFEKKIQATLARIWGTASDSSLPDGASD